MLSRILGLAALLACLPAHAWAQGSVLRPIDRATVRVLAIEGARPTLESVGGTSYRVANNDVSLGSGLAIEPRVVVTAAHVIRGAHAWIVTAPDAPERAFAAHPIYVHPSLDLAFLAVDGDLPHHARLGRARQLRNAEAITISGYPLEMSEATPASASGQLARVREDGTLQLSIAVNPGHSGGPVADGRGRPIGIVTMRGDPERGAGASASPSASPPSETPTRPAGRWRHTSSRRSTA